MNDMRIMLVDDNAELRRSLRESLSHQEGMRIVAECGTGLEALETLDKTEVDAIVLDIIMPQMDGYGVLEQLMTMKLGKKPGVIALTALGRDDFITRAINLGACYYMVKPFDFSILTKALSSFSDTPFSHTMISDICTLLTLQ